MNLERPLRADGRFDGHIVQGHVDGLGVIVDLRPSGAAAELVVAVPPGLERYLVEKGSVAVDGISLTVAGAAPAAVSRSRSSRIHWNARISGRRVRATG